jgi:glycerophosphoryl diester phosphodiesterase
LFPQAPFPRTIIRERAMRWLADIPVAHRGFHDLRRGCAENTLSAFRAAIDHGYTIECDVALSADGVPVMFHDDMLDRLTGLSGPLESLDAATLATIPVLGTTNTVPRLEEVLSLVAGRVPLLIELKSGRGRRGRLEPAVASLLAGYKGPVAIQSFDPKMVAWFRHNMPHIPRGQISMVYAMGDGEHAPPHQHAPLTRLAFWDEARPDFIAYDVKGLPNWAVARRRREGVPVLTWTIRTASDRARAALHADNVIFEGYRA